MAREQGRSPSVSTAPADRHARGGWQPRGRVVQETCCSIPQIISERRGAMWQIWVLFQVLERSILPFGKKRGLFLPFFLKFDSFSSIPAASLSYWGLCTTLLLVSLCSSSSHCPSSMLGLLLCSSLVFSVLLSPLCSETQLSSSPAQTLVLGGLNIP